jgi:YbgC/YbaW family acyl-CoA thioester hydrolase
VRARDSGVNWGRAAERAKARLLSQAAGAPAALGEPAARVRVLYADTDAGGVVYHGSYLRFFEAGRTEALRAAGIPFSRFAEQKLHLPLIEQTVRYHAPAFYDNVLLVHVKVSELRRVQSLSSTR